MKVELKADVTRTGRDAPVAQITDFSGTNMTGKLGAEIACAIATELIENVRTTARKDTPAGKYARAALDLFGLDPKEGNEVAEEPGADDDETVPAGTGTSGTRKPRTRA